MKVSGSRKSSMVVFFSSKLWDTMSIKNKEAFVSRCEGLWNADGCEGPIVIKDSTTGEVLSLSF